MLAHLQGKDSTTYESRSSRAGQVGNGSSLDRPILNLALKESFAAQRLSSTSGATVLTSRLSARQERPTPRTLTDLTWVGLSYTRKLATQIWYMPNAPKLSSTLHLPCRLADTHSHCGPAFSSLVLIQHWEFRWDEWWFLVFNQWRHRVDSS